MSKKRAKRPKPKGLSKADALKRLRRQVKGLIVEWDDVDPLAESRVRIDGKFSHRNPVMNIDAQKTFAGMGNFIVNEQPFMWHMEITGVFEYDKVINHETRVISGFCTIGQANEYALDSIEEIFRYGSMDKYVTTKFKLECIGLTQ